ncbi:D-methionine transport system ATP-binding protein [Pullulanibacillus pueri]|uniref:Methionine import ATP-binding protein MetN 1 n=1 Tax=Pullulanibacillus pueri TaxID=1437324 RepID=A0A8J2ZXT4_9BACL|nr:methionine ABC transporter ATP-binding protein [Pullulanibacillus pueri]MBM7682876.1 D-methionine transport system ATP-binding protein [Pullulanibacillus pueri]GGH84359.1 methionine import ATP-binding protein MetN 1 [Pullulanibacillus pueri]
MLVLKDIHKVYGKDKKRVEALKGINLEVGKGEIFGVIGFSGAGKSTLIRCVNLLERPTSGQVLINNVDMQKLPPRHLRKERKKIGMIFQQFNLLNAKTVFKNVAMPLIIDGRPKQEIEKKVNELLSFVGLSDKAKQYPEQLSGGQKQRVGIARALATDPHILLCDEATSALDPDTTQSILELLKKVRNELGITILIITHEMNVIRDICDKVAVIDGGVIVEQGSVLDVFSEPKKEITKNFVRTILNDEIPPTIKTFIKTKHQHSDSHYMYRVLFKGASANNPLLSNIAKQFPVDVNVIHGTITELQGIPFGNLIIELQGKPEDIKQALAFIKQQEVIVKEVDIHAT